ncbi:CvpA family protein [Patescibacteria group bacterium]
MNMMINWIDIVIFVVLLYFLVSGWEQGVIHLLASLVSFIISFGLALRLNGYVGTFLTDKFGIDMQWSYLLGYVLVAFVAGSILTTSLRVLADKVPIKIVGSKVNHWFGAFVSVLNGLLITTFVLILIQAMPLKGSIRNDIGESYIGNNAMVLSKTYAGEINTSIEQAVKQAKTFLTVTPDSGEDITFDFSVTPDELSIDEVSEREMVRLINEERDKIGLSKLYIDTQLTFVAQLYSRQMFLSKHFSHVDVDGETAADRLSKSNIVFIRAGENLAYAPDVEIAHKGLMNSERHRVNILDRRYRRVGIGVIDAGEHGKVFTQLFAD